MRVGLITTINTNIGDDLIRKGICSLLKEVFKGHKIEFIPVNKHQPLTVYPDWHPVHFSKMTRYLPRGAYRASRLIEQFASKLKHSRFDTCDLVVQCGAPVLWPGCHQCEWAEPLWHQVVGRLSERTPVLNLAAGACYPWERQPVQITDVNDAKYLRTILSYCRLTTVRDRLAQCLCASLGTRTPVIPCSAFLAARDHAATPRDGDVVLLNYMSGGGHYDWHQKVDRSAWRETVKTLIARLQIRHRLAFLCHNEVEHNLAWNLDSTIPRLWPRNTQQYFDLVSEAKVAVCNRMHACVVLAGLGIPSIAVCTDTRLLMVEALGLPCIYVKEADVDRLEEGLEKLLVHHCQERERLLVLKSETWNSYVKVVAHAT